MQSKNLIDRFFLVAGFVSAFVVVAGYYLWFIKVSGAPFYSTPIMLIAIASELICGICLLKRNPAIGKAFIVVGVLFIALGFLTPQLQTPPVKV